MQIKITLVADYDPYQGGELTADPDIRTLQYKHVGGFNLRGMGWLANEDEQGLSKDYIKTNTGKSTDHAILTFFGDINSVKEGKYKWDGVNHTVAKREVYSRDSIEILKRLGILLLNHKEFFYDTSYGDSTQLIIDSIIYSPDLNRLAVFIITKNPTSRRPIPDKENFWYYDATCYLGVKENDTISLSMGGPGFSNSTNQQELSGIIRESYFTEYANNDTSRTSTSKYNLSDIRFWNSFIWEKIKADKIKKLEFEKEKKEHPENVYEPK